MNINDLIQELCPNGVEWKKLGEAFDVRDGTHDSPKKVDNGQYLITSKNVKNGGIDYSKAYYISNTDYTNINKRSKVNKTDLLFTMIGTIGEVAYIDFEPNFAIKNIGLIKTNNFNFSKFLFYYLQGNEVKKYIQNNKSSGSQAFLSLNILRALQIPIPPLEIQEKIVEILDKYTLNFEKINNSINQELKQREKQFLYYKNKLLTFDDENPLNYLIKELCPNGVKYVKLGEVCNKVSNIKWKIEKGSFKYVDLTSVDRNNCKIIETKVISQDNAPSRAQQILHSDDVIYATTRPMLNRYCYITEDYHKQICSTGFCVLRADKTKILPKWIFFNLNTNPFLIHIKTYQQGTSYPSISNLDLMKFPIPLPPLEIQEKIVEILDKFTLASKKINKALNLELKQRQKEFNYYKSKLLDFAKKENNAK